MGMRILLLLAIGWVMGLTATLLESPKFWTGETGDMYGISPPHRIPSGIVTQHASNEHMQYAFGLERLIKWIV